MSVEGGKGEDRQTDNRNGGNERREKFEKSPTGLRSTLRHDNCSGLLVRRENVFTDAGRGLGQAIRLRRLPVKYCKKQDAT